MTVSTLDNVPVLAAFAKRQDVAAATEVDDVGRRDRRAERDGVGRVAADQRLDVRDRAGAVEVAERQACRAPEPRSMTPSES